MYVYWLEQTHADLPAGDDWLSAAEAVRRDGFRFARRRAEWILGRWTAKLAVAAYLGPNGDRPALNEAEIRPDPSGAPRAFLADRPAPVTISISHRAGLAVCAVGPPATRLGCDLELVEARSDRFAAEYFTAEEQEFAASACPGGRDRLLTLLWSAKESVLKALHSGLRLDTRVVSVEPGSALGAGHWAPLRARDAIGRTYEGWWLVSGELIRTLISVPSSGPPVYASSTSTPAAISMSR